MPVPRLDRLWSPLGRSVDGRGALTLTGGGRNSEHLRAGSDRSDPPWRQPSRLSERIGFDRQIRRPGLERRATAVGDLPHSARGNSQELEVTQIARARRANAFAVRRADDAPALRRIGGCHQGVQLHCRIRFVFVRIATRWDGD